MPIEYRLLIDIEVIEYLHTLPSSVRRRLFRHFQAIKEFPSAHSDFRETDASGRNLDVSVCANFAIFYWEDFADRHVKIMALMPADKT